MSLYRKYRPQTFADVAGQDHVVSTLENAVTQGKLAHAYLFAGSRGTGKTSVARILAKTMLTRGIEEEILRKQIIEGVEEGHLVDLVEIDAASNRGIDDIRGLIEKIQFSPVVGSAKVYIIDEVHMLTREAFNALLKTLEEPPPYAFFILATTELQKIPATIQSRCQRFTFRQIREDDIIRRLQYICDQEHIDAERAALRAIAHHAQGGMRDAISLLDQLRSLPKITSDDVRERMGESGHEHVEAILDALDGGDRQAIIGIVRKIEEAGIPLDAFARQLLGEIRVRLHAAIDNKEPSAALNHMLAALLNAIRDLRASPLPGLALESALLALCAPTPGEAAAPSAPRKKKQDAPPAEETRAVPATAPKKEAEKPDAPAQKETMKEALVEAPAVTLESVHQHWPAVLHDVSPPSVKMSLKNARVHAVRGSTLTLCFTSGFHRDKVANTEASRQVEEILEKIFKQSLRIDCLLEEERSPVAAEADLVNLAEAASEVF